MLRLETPPALVMGHREIKQNLAGLEGARKAPGIEHHQLSYLGVDPYAEEASLFQE